MFCDQCGKEIKLGIKFCPHCGAPVRDMTPPQPVQNAANLRTETPARQESKLPKKKNILFPVLCVLIALLVLGAGGFFLYQSGLLEDAGDLIDTVISRKDDRDAEKDAEEERDEMEEESEEEPEEESEQDATEPEDTESTEQPEAAGTPVVEQPEVEIPEIQQEILVSCSGSSAMLTLNVWEDGQWSEVMSTQAQIGSNGISQQKQEGDRCTPAGTYDLLFCFSDQSVDTGLPLLHVQEGDVWVCDPESDYYNTLQNSSASWKDWNSSESMYDKFAKDRSSACIYFAFNGDGLTGGSATPNGGSALFLDGVGSAGNMNSGYGDIKISASDMNLLLQYLDADKHPVITIF